MRILCLMRLSADSVILSGTNSESSALSTAYSVKFPQKHKNIPAVASFILNLLNALIEYLEVNNEFRDKFLAVCQKYPSVYQDGLHVYARDIQKPKCYFSRPLPGTAYRWILDLPMTWDWQAFQDWG